MHVLHIISSALSAYYIYHPHFSPAKYCPANIRLFFNLQRKFQQNRHHVVPHLHPSLRPPLPRGGAALPADGRHPLHRGANDATPPLRTRSTVAPVTLRHRSVCSPVVFVARRSVPAPYPLRLFTGCLTVFCRRGVGVGTEPRRREGRG